MISETKSPVVGIGLEKITTNPNTLQTLIALLKLRTLRIIRDLQKLYFMILLPLGLAALGLYFNSMQNLEPRFKPLELNGYSYGNESRFAVHNGTEEDLDGFLNELVKLGVSAVDMYDGNYSKLLSVAPHMAALNINTFGPDYGITVIYNDTAQHSLPIILNLISNTMYRLMVSKDSYESIEPIEVKVLPFQQTSQPEAFNLGVFSSAAFMGMIFVLIPVSLAIDMVYDREVNAFRFQSSSVYNRFSDKSEEPAARERSLLLHVLHDLLHRVGRDHGADLSGAAGDNNPL